METNTTILGLSGVVSLATPIIFASIGETFTEKAGVTNLSLNGTIILSAMAGFVCATLSQSILLGFIAGGVIGALVALIIAFASIKLKQSQVAVGFVLTLLCRDLAYFLGTPYIGCKIMRISPAFKIPLLCKIPIIGPIFFNQDYLTYLSYLLIIVSMIWFFRTREGLILEGIGERPATAYIRGVNVNQRRIFYTALGGFLVGLAGPMYSLDYKAGWKGTISGLDGYGWIVLALVIFGGWHPLKVAIGAYFFSLLQWLGLALQPALSGVPSQALQVAPFPLMILTLVLVNLGNTDWVDRALAGATEKNRRFFKKIIRAMRNSPPAALGTPFEPD